MPPTRNRRPMTSSHGETGRGKGGPCPIPEDTEDITNITLHDLNNLIDSTVSDSALSHGDEPAPHPPPHSRGHMPPATIWNRDYWAELPDTRDRSRCHMGNNNSRKTAQPTLFFEGDRRDVPQWGQDSRCIQAVSWNLGSGGIRSVIPDLAIWAEANNPAVIHLQEARITKRDVPKVRKELSFHLPKYQVYMHCKAWDSESERPHSVVTLIRRELAKYSRPLNVNPDPGNRKSATSGRIIAIRMDIPGSSAPIYFINVWLPHGGMDRGFRTEFLDDMSRLKAQWGIGQNALWLGDWNASMSEAQRSCAPSGATRDWEREVRAWVDRNRLRTIDHDEWTWFSMAWAATLDHGFSSVDSPTWSATLDEGLGVHSDHKMLCIHLHEDWGTWREGKPKNPARKTNPDWSQLHDHQDDFRTAVQESKHFKPDPSRGGIMHS